MATTERGSEMDLGDFDVVAWIEAVFDWLLANPIVAWVLDFPCPFAANEA